MYYQNSTKKRVSYFKFLVCFGLYRRLQGCRQVIDDYIIMHAHTPVTTEIHLSQPDNMVYTCHVPTQKNRKLNIRIQKYIILYFNDNVNRNIKSKKNPSVLTGYIAETNPQNGIFKRIWSCRNLDL